MKIKFTSGTLSKFSDEYCLLVLKHGDKEVYRATVPNDEAKSIKQKHAKPMKISWQSD